jgi:hypothetical protein
VLLALRGLGALVTFVTGTSASAPSLCDDQRGTFVVNAESAWQKPLASS